MKLKVKIKPLTKYFEGERSNLDLWISLIGKIFFVYHVLSVFRLNEVSSNSKMDCNLRSVEELEIKLGEHQLPWDEIAPTEICDWLDILSKTHGCSKDLTIINMLACTGALLGDSTLKLFTSWKEHGNLFYFLFLFFLVLAPSGNHHFSESKIA